VKHKLVGLLLDDKGVLRNHQRVVFAGGEGEITSGSFGPTLERSVALARVPASVENGAPCEVDVRGRMLKAHVVKYPFIRNGKSLL
jgi:aminomethyltransferase